LLVLRKCASLGNSEVAKGVGTWCQPPIHPTSLEGFLYKDLVEIPRIDCLIDLKKLDVRYSLKCEVPILCAFTKLQVLDISNE